MLSMVQWTFLQMLISFILFSFEYYSLAEFFKTMSYVVLNIFAYMLNTSSMS